MGDAAVDRVADARLRLVCERVDGVLPLHRRKIVEQLGDVAGTKDTVHTSKLRWVVWREVGREDASLGALAPTSPILRITFLNKPCLAWLSASTSFAPSFDPVV